MYIKENPEKNIPQIYELLFDNINDCVAVYKAENNGRDFIIHNFNKSAEETENVNREEIIGKNIVDVFPGVKEFGLYDVLRHVWETGISEHHPLNIYRDNKISGWRKNYIFKVPGEDIIVSVYRDVTEDEKLRENLAVLSKFPEEDPYPVLRVSHDLKLLYANQGSKILLKSWNIKPGESIPEEYKNLISLAVKNNKHTITEALCNNTIYSLVITPVEKHDYVNIYGRDITIRKKTEDKLKKTNRMYAFLSQINQTIVKSESREELLENICEIAVKYGKFNFAWLGLMNHKENSVDYYMSYGDEIKNINKLKIPLHAGEDEANGIFGKAILNKNVSVSNDIQSDPNNNYIRNNILSELYNSAAALPFLMEKRIAGILAVFTREKNFFDSEEIRLLEEIKTDISFKLKDIKIEKEKDIISEKLFESEENMRRILSEMPMAVITCDVKGNIRFVNQRMLEMLGSPSEESTKSINLLDFPPLEKIGFPDLIKRCISTKTKLAAEKEYTSKWGKKTIFECYFLPLINKDRDVEALLLMAFDKSEKKNFEESSPVI